MSGISAFCRFFCLTLCVALGANAYGKKLYFDWPVPTTLLVTAKINNFGESSTARYRVDLVFVDEQELEVRFSNFRFVSLDGVSADGEKYAPTVDALESVTSRLPTIRISQSGEYLGTLGLEEMRKNLIELLPQRSREEGVGAVDEYLNSSRLEEAMYRQSGETWNLWVGAWNGLDLLEGERVSGILPVRILGRKIEQNLRIEHLGATPERCDSCVHLKMTTVVEGPEVVQLAEGLIFGGESGGSREAEKFTTARSITVTELFAEEETLLPKYATTVTEVILRQEDAKPYSRKSSKQYWFAWE